MRTITIKGQGKIQRRPDTIVVQMEITSMDMKYDEAMNQMDRKTSLIQDSLIQIGFRKEDIKTSFFDCKAKYGYENQKRIFHGYHIRESMSLCFDLDMKMLSKVMDAMKESGVKPEISISFTLKDKEAISDEVLRLAYFDAKRKAEVILKASTDRLGKLNHVEYHFEPLEIQSDTRMRCMSINDGPSVDMDVTPQDIDIQDSAVFVWEIE